MTDSDIIAGLALLSSFISIPITYKLGRHSAKNDFINSKIDEAITILDRIYEHSISVVNAPAFNNEQYMFQLGLFLKLSWLVKEINKHDCKNKEQLILKLRNVKQIMTNDIFFEQQRHNVLNKLIVKSSELKCLFNRKF